MINLKINNSEIKICESTAQIAVVKLDERSVDEIIDLVRKNNYTCRVIYSKTDQSLKLASNIGGEITTNYDYLQACLGEFQ